ncbi:PilZ domain-containing protein [Agaribacterium haliotis]|uniref:PilZ domain-containing protein n=1 Tax=Agaribacterium haliotis TaxID=2013869 RepID=UPI000BB54D04|nr:PilZ domain-containing protein [Agaribacterium haliotis]
MSDSSERRRFTRVNFDTAATLAQGESVSHTQLVDISLKGVLLKTPANYELRADQGVDISIFLNKETEIQMKVELVHSSNRYLGFHCVSLDVESASHLRRLIELNIDDAGAADRVLDELLFSHESTQ